MPRLQPVACCPHSHHNGCLQSTETCACNAEDVPSTAGADSTATSGAAQVDVNDPIYQAMLTASKSPQRSALCDNPRMMCWERGLQLSCMLLSSAQLGCAVWSCNISSMHSSELQRAW